MLSWFVNYVIYKLNRSVAFAIKVRKTYFQVVTLSVQTVKIKKSCFKRTINWNKDQSNELTQAQS